MGCSGSCPEKEWEISPGGGSEDTSQGQGVATDVGCAFDRVTANKSKTTFSNGQVDLP